MTGTNGKETAASLALCPDYLQAEYRDWHDLPFVDGDKPWCPVAVTGRDDPAHIAEIAVGIDYALRFISYLRRHSRVDCASNLVEIVEAMTGKQLGSIESSFLSALAEYIATGRIALTIDYETAARS